jgi:ABC-type branched-subunit amino acid transport system ATPase component
MKDPELMAEAKKMMESPEYQKQMKQFAGNKDFKDAAQKASNMMKDPAKAAAMEAKMEHMMKVGADQLKAGAGKMMEDAMAAMNDPKVMAEMTKMVQDPSFQANLADMAKDPSFKQYIDAVSMK